MNNLTPYKFIINDKTFNGYINTEDYSTILKLLSPIKTGYERTIGEVYHTVGCNNELYTMRDADIQVDNAIYEAANYYSSEEVAANNARADKLMCQLRRFAVENRKHDIDWNNQSQSKWSIYYDYSNNTIDYDCSRFTREFNNIIFDSVETVALVIEAYRDELIWYFTEYKDSL